MLDFGRRAHLRAAVLLGPDLACHPGEGAAETGKLAGQIGQLVEQGTVEFVAPEGLGGIGQIGQRAVHAREAAAEFVDDRDGDRRVFGAEAHQAVLLDARGDNVGARDHGRGARHVGKDAQLADNPVASDGRHVHRPGRQGDKHVDLAFQDHRREAAGLAFVHQLVAASIGGDAELGSDSEQRIVVKTREDRVRRQNPRDLLGGNRRCSGLGQQHRHGLPPAGTVRQPPERTSRPGRAPVSSPFSKVGVPATSVAR